MFLTSGNIRAVQKLLTRCHHDSPFLSSFTSGLNGGLVISSASQAELDMDSEAPSKVECEKSVAANKLSENAARSKTISKRSTWYDIVNSWFGTSSSEQDRDSSSRHSHNGVDRIEGDTILKRRSIPTPLQSARLGKRRHRNRLASHNGVNPIDGDTILKKRSVDGENIARITKRSAWYDIVSSWFADEDDSENNFDDTRLRSHNGVDTIEGDFL